MKNIYLIGFMGTGKSTIGRLIISKKNDLSFVEMDESIENEAEETINHIFESKGEEYFRDLETNLVRRISQMDGTVVSCGGGAVLRKENVEMMKKSGKIVLLTASPESIYKRVKDDTSRPLLKDNMNIEHIEKMMARRRDIYLEAADVIIDTDQLTLEEIAINIMDLI